jgi:zinc transporter, ZIP family
VLRAGLWGFVGGLALLIGAAGGIRFRASQRVIGVTMAFGVGVLISALAFDLTEEAFDRSGATVVSIGLTIGALSFFSADWIIDRRGGAHRKRSGGEQQGGSGMAIVIGALMDGIPESVVIGVSLIGGGSVAVPVVVAVFLSNVPEAFSAVTGLKQAGKSVTFIMGLWTGVAAASTLSAALGYQLLGGASATTISVIQAFAAGAILTMLADTMMPEAFQHGGPQVGLATTLGFSLAFVVSNL